MVRKGAYRPFIRLSSINTRVFFFIIIYLMICVYICAHVRNISTFLFFYY